VTGTIVQEFWRGANVRRSTTGTDFLTALIGLVGRNKRRYGGYIVHLGIVLIFLGFAGEGYKRDDQVLLKPTQEATVGSFTLRNDGVKVSDDGQKQMVTGYISVFEGGKQIDTLYPAKWFFRKHEEEPTTEVAIRRSVVEDLYVVLGAYDLGTQTASLQIVINPLVNWIWLGFGVMALGTGIALLPERTYAFALANMPEDAAATTIALLLAVFLSTASLSAQHAESAQAVLVVPRSALEKQLQGEIICMCGTCGRQLLNACQCGLAAEMRKEVASLVNAGKTHDEVIQYYIAKYGSQEPLAAPIDKGFNRLAWLFPYLIGASGAVVVGVAAVRLSRRPVAAALDAPATADPDLEERLDDELRNLD